jgi:hypothetical protein
VWFSVFLYHVVSVPVTTTNKLIEERNAARKHVETLSRNHVTQAALGVQCLRLCFEMTDFLYEHLPKFDTKDETGGVPIFGVKLTREQKQDIKEEAERRVKERLARLDVQARSDYDPTFAKRVFDLTRDLLDGGFISDRVADQLNSPRTLNEMGEVAVTLYRLGLQLGATPKDARKGRSST